MNKYVRITWDQYWPNGGVQEIDGSFDTVVEAQLHEPEKDRNLFTQVIERDEWKVVSERYYGERWEPCRDLSKSQVVRIVPPEREGSGVLPAQGTRVFVGDTEVDGVQKIVMTAEVNGVWQAVITCHADMSEMDGVTARFEKGAVIDVTDLSDQARRYRKADLPGPCPPDGPPPPESGWMG